MPGANSQIATRVGEIMEDMKKRMDAEAKERLKAGCRYLVTIVLSQMEGFNDVTGNTKNSIAVGLFYNRKLQFIAFSFDALHHAPTRATLKSGEVYDLDYYWDGTPVAALGRPYRAPSDSGADESFWSFAEAFEYIQTLAPSQNGFSFVIVSAVDYAKYLEACTGVNILEQTRTTLAGMGALVSDLR